MTPSPKITVSSINAAFSDLRGKHRTEPVPPETYRLMANVDATLKEQVLDLAQRHSG
jgi:hypothetical protein